jgi:hypothetical protein
MFTTLNFSSWTDYKTFAGELSDNWAFRGQSDTRWELRNAIERTDFITLYKGIEIDFLQELCAAHEITLAKDETPEHLIEWLALDAAPRRALRACSTSANRRLLLLFLPLSMCETTSIKTLPSGPSTPTI